MLKDLVTPENANVFVGKLGDILEKQLINPWAMPLTGVEFGHSGLFTLKQLVAVVEFGAASSPRYDVERFGIIEAFGSLRQCDLVVCSRNYYKKDGSTS